MRHHPYFEHDAATAALAAVAFFILLSLEIRQSTRSRPGARVADGGTRPLIRVFVGAGVVGAVLTTARVPAAAIGAEPAAFSIGLVVMCLGIGLRLWSFHTLGQYFTFTVQTSSDQTVIDTGPYRLLRHPSYTAIWVILIGVGLLYGNWLALACLAVAGLIGVLLRIRVEERVLSAELGPAYTQFAASRKRLVPFIW